MYCLRQLLVQSLWAVEVLIGESRLCSRVGSTMPARHSMTKVLVRSGRGFQVAVKSKRI